MTLNNKENLIFAYAHLPEKIRFLANPPKDVTTDKYTDLNYLCRCYQIIEELKEEDFNTRSDRVSPYSKDVLLKHFENTIKEVKNECD